MTGVADDEREIVGLGEESLLFGGGGCWVGGSGAGFDVAVGGLDGAETSGIVGVCLLGGMERIVPQRRLGLCRDDGLAVVGSAGARELDRFREGLHGLFRQEQLEITVDICGDSVDCLGVVLDLRDVSCKPCRKPDDAPSCIDAESGHTPGIIGRIPAMMSARLSGVSGDEKCLNGATRDCGRALEIVGVVRRLHAFLLVPSGRGGHGGEACSGVVPPAAPACQLTSGRSFLHYWKSTLIAAISCLGW